MEENLQIEKLSEIQVIANNINSGLKAFEERKSELTTLRDRVTGLKIENIDDKAAIAEVSTARKTLKKARVEIEKEGKSMRDPLTKISKSISEKQNELIDIISPTEKDLQAKEDWVKAEQDKIDQAEADKKQALIQVRIDKLAAYGFAIDITFLTAIDEEQFEKVLDNARIEYEREQSVKAEADRLEQEKQAKIEKDLSDLKELREKQAEADRIIRERQEELDRQAKALKDQQDEAEERERQRIKAEFDTEIKRRVNQLTAFGLTFDFSDNHYKGFGYFVPVLDIQTHDVEKWDGMIIKMGPHIEEVKAKELEQAEEKRLKDIEDARQKAIKDEQERVHLAAEKEKEHKRSADLRKQEELEKAGDKAIWADFISRLEAVAVPTLRSGQYRKIGGMAREKLDEIQKLRP